MRFFFLAFLFVLLFLSEKVQGQAVSWGDQGNGTYINPILNADYSDPDVIRVGDKIIWFALIFIISGCRC